MTKTEEGAWPTRASTAQMLRLAWPFVLGNSLWTIQIVFDRVLLGQRGGKEVGAGMVAAMLFWTGFALLQYTANYATAFVAQYTGAGQPRRAGAVVWQSLWFSVAAGLAFLLLIPLAEPIVALGGHTPALQKLEATYFRCLCFAVLPALLSASAGSFFAGRGDSRTVLVINGTGLAVHVVCAYAWIFGRWGFEAHGVAGAGWAHVTGCTTSAVLALSLMLRRRHRETHGTASEWRLDGPLLRRLLRFGLPNGVGVALDTLSFTVFLLLVGRLGEAELAATSIACTLNLLALLPMLGVAQAVEVLVGQRLGEDRPDEAARSTWAGLAVAAPYTVAVALAYVLVPDLLAAPFYGVGDAGRAAVAALVPGLLRFVALYCLFDCGNLVFSFALRGAGDTRFVTAVATALSWLGMVLPTWAAWRYGWGLNVAWAFASGYIMLLALTFLLRFLQGRWRSMRVIEVPAPPTIPDDAGVKWQMPAAGDAPEQEAGVTAREGVQPEG